MGITAEDVASAVQRVARRSGRVRRREPAARRGGDRRAARSSDEIVPVDVPQKKGDPVLRRHATNIRAPGTTAEKLAALKPAFKKDGTVTAGNASGINDGAAALVVATSEKARADRHARRSRGSWRTPSTGVDPTIMGIGPVPAVRKALERADSRSATSISSS